MALTYDKLSPERIAESLAELNEDGAAWTAEGDVLTRHYEFREYGHGLLFASGVGFLAERLNHHPDLEIGYRRVSVRLSTHDAGGLTAYDFALAAQIEDLFCMD
jgi:4a-hydroxytetrahydrobiopterin dehydratase